MRVVRKGWVVPDRAQFCEYWVFCANARVVAWGCCLDDMITLDVPCFDLLPGKHQHLVLLCEAE